ncbi:hypothetical protein SO802_016505 [Lithocarpus litseifolius]|uniref:Uncharacterized protein n=1 Tax=Lithocarpus litseifolius TaxID=425828 RepID=A0AAW2CZ89_9ROSI
MGEEPLPEGGGHRPWVITINGKFPGPLINTTTNNFVHVNVFNNMEEPLLFTWNGIQQRLNSWQDGVSGADCPILPSKNWTRVFQTKDQIGSFFYFPSINFHKAAGGFGPIRVYNCIVIVVPFPKPEAEFDLLFGDWIFDSYSVSALKIYSWSLILEDKQMAFQAIPDIILMNEKGPYGHPLSKSYESFSVTKDQNEVDYYIAATPKLLNNTGSRNLDGVAVLQYSNSITNVSGPLTAGPDPFNFEFSVNQAKSISRWNMTVGAARLNPQGTFNVTNVTLSQIFILQNSLAEIQGHPRYVVNNVSYLTPNTPLKLADYLKNGSQVYNLDQFPVKSVNDNASYGISIVTGNHKGWIELVFKNHLDVMDSWHFDGFGFYVVGFGNGEWIEESRKTRNFLDPVVRSTVQVYLGGWSAVYAFLNNPGMWNLRSQNLKNWYLGQELYLRVHDDEPNPAKERPPPQNLLRCVMIDDPHSPPPTGPPSQVVG